MQSTTIPSQARVVIIGGGIIGTSVAYHLGLMGCSDVVLIERDQLTSGTTWHAAGLMVTYGSTSETSTEIRKYTKDLYSRLEKETGLSTGFKPIGFIELATNKDRLEEFRRVSAFNRYCGVDVEEISAQEVLKLFPLARVDDVEAGFYVKTDGRVNPVDATMSMAKGARMKGVKILENVSCTGILKKNNQVTGVRTNLGDIKAEVVVNCAGMWARQFGEMSGVTIPNQAAEHYYMITEDIPGLSPDLPVLEDPASYGYFREEVGGMMVGLFEPICAPWKIEGIPQNFSFGEINPDWDRMAPYLEKAMSRIPMTMNVGIKKFFCGPESFTPDLKPIIGEAPELKNYFVAAGLNSIGILTAGGLGRVMSHWILNGTPDVDVTGFNIDRLQAYQNTPKYRKTRTVESLGMVYRCHYPTMSYETARGVKKSPFHDRLLAQGAYFKDVSGWEGADWYAPTPAEAKVEKLSWGRHHWFEWWQQEHKACRENVIIMDMSFMSKFLVQGRDAGKVLNYISTNNVDNQIGIITYTQWLNTTGKLEGDVTITKLAEDKFLVVVTDTQHRHAEAWIKKNTPSEAHCFITDVTSSYGQLNLQGPKSRELLQRLTTVNLSNEAFPFRMAKEIDLGFAKVLCIRITYLGELGYELYISSENATHVYDQIIEMGKDFNLTHAGLKALGSLRLEKGYKDYGHDIDNTDDPFETGLSFCLDLKKESGFIGRDAILSRKEKPITRKLLQLKLLDPDPMLYHAEVVYRDSKMVGYVRAGSYGHSIGGAVGLFMCEAQVEINQSYLDQAKWEVEIAGQKYPIQVSLKPFYDPKNERIKK